MEIIIGSRSSKLALWQAEHVAARLEATGATTQIVTFETKGDKILDRSLAKIGSKGLFTEELEEALRAGSIHIAVHSAKDMQSSLPHDLEILAFTEREQPHDVLISHKPGINLATPGLVVGTSSVRRRALLARFYPQIQLVDMRGNLQTRIQKMKDGQCDALMLAYAGVHRMEYSDMIAEHLPVQVFIPPVGQASLAIQTYAGLNNEAKTLITQALHHEASALCLRAERNFLRTLEGGCSVPAFAHASYSSDGKVFLQGGVISTDGAHYVHETLTAEPESAETAGRVMAEKVLRRGGKDILDALKSEK